MISIRKGTIIAGKYRIEEPLARGGMGSIWVARHIQLDVLVAVKFIDPDFASTAEGRGRFEREAKSAAMLHSPHVVQIHDYGVEYETPYIAMELLQGEDLSTRLKREGRVSMAEAAKIAIHVSKALRRAHDAGIVHRDLKPSNIFIVHGGDEDEELIKVLDFGVAKMLSLGSASDDETKRGALIGSPRYMSPEQARRNREIDHRSDLWSLGVILFRAITGQLPFPGDEIGDVIVKICSDPLPIPSEIAPDLEPAVDRFFLKALARDPAERFQTAREMASEFAVMAGALPAASHFTWPLPGDGMRISWLPGMTVESSPSLSGGALIMPTSSPTPHSPVMRGGPTPMPIAVVAAPLSMTMPSADAAAAAVAVSVARPSGEPISQTVPLHQPHIIPMPPSTPTILDPAKSRDRTRITEGTVLIAPPASGVQLSGPPSSDRTRLLAGDLSTSEGEAPKDESAEVVPAIDFHYRPMQPTPVMEPVEVTRRSSPSWNDMVSKGAPPLHDAAPKGPPSSDRLARRSAPSSARGTLKSAGLSDDASEGLPAPSPGATLTSSTGTVDIPAGRSYLRPRRPVALWIVAACAVVIVGGALAMVRLSLSGGGAAPEGREQAARSEALKERRALPVATLDPAASVSLAASAATMATAVVSAAVSSALLTPPTSAHAPAVKPEGVKKKDTPR